MNNTIERVKAFFGKRWHVTAFIQVGHVAARPEDTMRLPWHKW